MKQGRVVLYVLILNKLDHLCDKCLISSVTMYRYIVYVCIVEIALYLFI